MITDYLVACPQCQWVGTLLPNQHRRTESTLRFECPRCKSPWDEDRHAIEEASSLPAVHYGPEYYCQVLSNILNQSRDYGRVYRKDVSEYVESVGSASAQCLRRIYSAPVLLASSAEHEALLWCISQYSRFAISFAKRPGSTPEAALTNRGYHWSGKNKQWERSMNIDPARYNLVDTETSRLIAMHEFGIYERGFFLRILLPQMSLHIESISSVK